MKYRILIEVLGGNIFWITDEERPRYEARIVRVLAKEDAEAEHK